MQSQGSTSSQPSFDSQSSSDSPLFSDSEQAEDDTDVFLTDSSSSAIIGEVSGAAADGDGGPGSPASKWACDDFTDKEEEEAYRSKGGGGGGKAARVGSDQADPTSHVPKSQGDLLFAQKVRDRREDSDGEAWRLGSNLSPSSSASVLSCRVSSGRCWSC